MARTITERCCPTRRLPEGLADGRTAGMGVGNGPQRQEMVLPGVLRPAKSATGVGPCKSCPSVEASREGGSQPVQAKDRN